jgi:hypothetical protein
MIKINVLSPEQRLLNAAIADFNTAQYEKSFSGRHPELGKMVNCKVCGTRHRVNEKKCEQVFTYRIGDYELFRENENGELVPDYRTAIRPDQKQTKKQREGSARFAKKRFNPHYSKEKLLFVERTRKIFQELGFSLEDTGEVFQKNLHRARILAAREIREERELRDRAIRRRQKVSRRINKGLA